MNEIKIGPPGFPGGLRSPGAGDLRISWISIQQARSKLIASVLTSGDVSI
jgi:hypothetical protein